MRKAGRRRFGGMSFDSKTGEIYLEGRRQRLRPQSARVLAILVERAGEAVTRQELRAAVWPDGSPAADKGLNACVRDIRHALGDRPDAPEFIETIPKYGYRFAAAVDPSGVRRPTRYRGLAVAVGLTALTIWALQSNRATDGGTDWSPSAERVFRRASALTREPGYAPLLRARAMLDTVLREFPNSGLAHAEASYVDFLLQNHEEAQYHVDRALALEPLSSKAYATRAAIALYWDGDEESAQRYVTIARSLGSEDPDVLLVAGFIAAATGRLGSARAYARRLASADLSAALRVNLGYLHYVLGQYAAMEQACSDALSSTRRVTEPLRCRVLARLAQGDDAGAARFASILLGVEPGVSETESTLTEFWTRELDRARRARRGPRGVAHLQAARALAALGRTRSAVDELLLAVPERPPALTHAGQLPWFASLPQHPRLRVLRARSHDLGVND